jgi:hypothetical protein
MTSTLLRVRNYVIREKKCGYHHFGKTGEKIVKILRTRSMHGG